MSIYHEAFSHIRSFPAIFWVTILATLMNQVGNMAMAFLVLFLTEALGFSLVNASFAFALMGICMVLTGLIGGSIIDKFGAAYIMIVALLGNGLVLFIFPWLKNFFLVFIFCSLWGIFFGIYRPASQAFISQLSKPGLHKVTFSVFRLVQNLGMSIGPALGGYLAYHAFASIFYVNAFANLFAALILMLGLSYLTLPKFIFSPAKKIALNLKWLKRDVHLRIFVLGMIPISMVFFQHDTIFGVYLRDELQLTLTFYGLLFTVNTLIIVCFELPLNIYTFNWPYRINFILGSLLITLGFVGIAFASTRWQILCLTVVWTVGEMVLYPAASSYVADISPKEHTGDYMSWYTTCSNLGMLFGPLAGGYIMQQFGGKTLWLICGLWGLSAMLIFNFIREPRKAIDKHQA